MKLQDALSCISGYDADALSVDQARAVIGRIVQPVAAAEYVALRSALDRVLAHDIVSPIDVPAHDNSAMDGYALNGADLRPDADTALLLAGTRLAGDRGAAAVARGSCLRIMTGAVMPPGCDTVVPQELCTLRGDHVVVPAGAVRAGDHRRLRGEDLAHGHLALLAGKLLRPAELGMLASLGIAEVPVRRRLRVAFFSTGSELRSLGEPLAPGCVYDSNRYTLHGMLARLNCELIDLGVVRDEPAALQAALRTACECADAVITSGGVSVGEADYTQQTMAQLGDVVFWHIAMRPGRPMAFGQIESAGRRAVLFGLPGNPVAVMVTFYHLVRDALLAMQGALPRALPLMRAVSATPIRKRPGRSEFQRGILTPRADGRWQVAITGAQGSGILRSMSESNAFIMLHHDQGAVAAGDEVDVLPYEGLV